MRHERLKLGVHVVADTAKLRAMPQPRRQSRAEGPQALLQIPLLRLRQMQFDGRTAAGNGPADGAAPRPGPGRGTRRAAGLRLRDEDAVHSAAAYGLQRPVFDDQVEEGRAGRTGIATAATTPAAPAPASASASVASAAGEPDARRTVRLVVGCRHIVGGRHRHTNSSATKTSTPSNE